MKDSIFIDKLSVNFMNFRVKKLTKMSESVATGLLSGVVKVSGFFTSSIVNSAPGKKFFSLLPGEIVLASLDGFSTYSFFQSLLFYLMEWNVRKEFDYFPSSVNVNEVKNCNLIHFMQTLTFSK